MKPLFHWVCDRAKSLHFSKLPSNVDAAGLRTTLLIVSHRIVWSMLLIEDMPAKGLYHGTSNWRCNQVGITNVSLSQRGTLHFQGPLVLLSSPFG